MGRQGSDPKEVSVGEGKWKEMEKTGPLIQGSLVTGFCVDSESSFPLRRPGGRALRRPQSSLTLGMGKLGVDTQIPACLLRAAPRAMSISGNSLCLTLAGVEG